MTPLLIASLAHAEELFSVDRREGMSAEDVLWEKLLDVLKEGCAEEYPPDEILLTLLSVIKVGFPVLSWVSAHPEAAKRLAEGTHVALSKDAEPDWWWCDVDPDDSGDSAYQAMWAAQWSMGAVHKLHSSFRGPTKWGVLAPSAEDDGHEARLFDTEAEARTFARALAASTPVTSDEAQGENARLRHECAGAGFHEHDGCSCSDAELLSRDDKTARQRESDAMDDAETVARRAGAAAMRAFADSNRVMDIAIKYSNSPTECIALGNEIKTLMLEASAATAAATVEPARRPIMTDAQIKHMVDRLLR